MGKSSIKLAWRLGVKQAYEPEFENLLRFVLRHRGVVDEVSFFETTTHHLYLPLDFFKEAASHIETAMGKLKGDGIPSVGINVLTTIGHVNEGWDFFPKLPFQPMVGHDGSVSRSCACPNTPEMRAYVKAKYALFAQAKPDFIWVDDDIRMHHHGVAYGCFCPTCLAIFVQSFGREFSRESLAASLNRPECGAVRKAWIEQNVRTIESLMADVVQAIHGVNPAIKTGLMTAGTGWTTYSGQAFDRWFHALKAAKARPGGGFYSDETPVGMFDKAIEMGRQNVLLPDNVKDIQYELENFPCTRLGKANVSIINECSLALAVGCNGIAFDAGAPACETLMPRVAEARPFWEEFVSHCDGMEVQGFWPAWHPQLMAFRSVREGDNWFDGGPLYNIARPNELARLGLPLSMKRSDGGVILSGRIAEVFSDAELRQMLAGPVIMDAFALETLTERGLGDLTGVRLRAWQDNGVAERMTDDQINGTFAGRLHDIRAEFWNDFTMHSARLQPMSSEVHVLSVLETYQGQRLDPCATAFENALGGRVVVMGYSPWRLASSKRSHILGAADWAAKGLLPVMIREALPVIPIVRMSPDRKRGGIMLMPTGLDPIERMTIEVRAAMAPAHLTAPGKPAEPLRPQREKNGWSVVIENITPWRALAILFG